MSDITLVEGNNQLNVQLIPLIADIRVVSFGIYPIPPPVAVVGNPIEIAARVTNYGTARSSKVIRCQVTGLEPMTKTVWLNPGQSTVIDFPRFTLTEPGTYQVSVDGLSKSFEVYEAAYWVGMGIYDETVPKYVRGTVIVDGTQHTIAAPYYSWQTSGLPIGYHTFDLVVPAGYRFIRWEVYDWTTEELLQTTYSRPLGIEITRHTWLYAIVHPV